MNTNFVRQNRLHLVPKTSVSVLHGSDKKTAVFGFGSVTVTALKFVIYHTFGLCYPQTYTSMASIVAIVVTLAMLLCHINHRFIIILLLLS